MDTAFKNIKYLTSLLIPLSLIACGSSGGSGGGAEASGDTTPPTISLVGDSTINIERENNAIYIESGATAIDDTDGDLSGSIIITGNVDIAIAGNYTVTYSVSDSSGNTANISRTVNVIDIIPPMAIDFSPAVPAFSQEEGEPDFSILGAIQNFVPDRAEPITDYFKAEHGSIVRNSHAVVDYPGCTATWISPYVAITAAHCNDYGYAGLLAEAYANRSLLNFAAGRETVPCQRLLASGFYASNADFALWDCRPEKLVEADPDSLLETDTYPLGVQYGYAVLDTGGVQEGTQLYSAWRNPVTGDPTLALMGNSTIYSEGEVTFSKVENRWAGPNFIGCEPDVPSSNQVDGHVVQMNMFSAPGASGSLHFGASSHRVRVGPLATGTGGRTAMSMNATLGRGLPKGDRMIVETYLPRGRDKPERVQTRFRYLEEGTLVDQDPVANCYDITQMTNLAVSDRNNDAVYDVVAETMAWNWAQPHHFFNFTDPLTRARWRHDNARQASHYTPILNAAVTTPLNPLAEGALSYTAPENQEGALILLEEERLVLAPEMNNIGSGQHRVSFELVVTEVQGSIVVFTSGCGVMHRGEIVLPDPRDLPAARMLLGVSLPVACSKPEIAVEITNGARAVLIRAISVVKEENVFNFAAIDERDMWTSSKDQFALFTADGDAARDIGTGQEFFGLNVDAGSSVSLRGYALEPGRDYEVSFRARSMFDGGRPSRFAYGPVNTGWGVVAVDGNWSDHTIRITAPSRANRNSVLTFNRHWRSTGTTIIDALTITPR